jgi:hypothetical protein
MAVAYDEVLEDRVLSRQGVKKRQRPFRAEIAEMMRYSVGYRSRAFVTIGEPIPLSGYDPESRRHVLDLAHHIMDTVGRLYKVVPSALVAAAMRPSMPQHDLEAAVDALICTLRDRGANLAVDNGKQAVEEGGAALASRGILVIEGDRYRVRNRAALRYYARTINHLVIPAAGQTR